MTSHDLLPAVAIAVSIAAFAVNLANFKLGQRRDRRDLFLKLHERLIDADLQVGRRLLYEKIRKPGDASALQGTAPAEYQQINRALAMFDVFAMYVDRGYVDRDLALEEWGHSIARAWTRAEIFLHDRDLAQTWKTWPALRAFAQEATAWHDAHLSG